jgi:predicted component of type VI protein secretion system
VHSEQFKAKNLKRKEKDRKSELRFHGNCQVYFKRERPMAPVSPLAGEQDTKGIVRYYRTKALDENQPPPSEEEIT